MSNHFGTSYRPQTTPHSRGILSYLRSCGVFARIILVSLSPSSDTVLRRFYTCKIEVIIFSSLYIYSNSMDTVDKSFVADKLNRNSCDSSEEQTKFYHFHPKHNLLYPISNNNSNRRNLLQQHPSTCIPGTANLIFDIRDFCGRISIIPRYPLPYLTRKHDKYAALKLRHRISRIFQPISPR